MSLESELWRKGTPGKYQGLISDRQRDQQVTSCILRHLDKFFDRLSILDIDFETILSKAWLGTCHVKLDIGDSERETIQRLLSDTSVNI